MIEQGIKNIFILFFFIANIFGNHIVHERIEKALSYSSCNIEAFVNDDATQWYDILASFAIILGALNLMKLQIQKVARKKKGWPYSLIAIGGFIFAITAGFIIKGVDDTVAVWGAHVTTEGTVFKWIFDFMFTPMSATMFSLLAFFVASASYRAFRIRNFEATLLLVAGVLLMLGRVPLGNTNYIPWWIVLSIYIFGIFALIAPFFKNKKLFFISIILSFILFGLFGIIAGWNMNPPQFLQLPSIQRWIFFNPQLAAARAIKIGIALGIIATSFRIITGRERGIFGD